MFEYARRNAYVRRATRSVYGERSANRSLNTDGLTKAFMMCKFISHSGEEVA